MNAPFERGHLRLVEPCLGDDARHPPSIEEVRLLWAEIRRRPIPPYERLTRLVIRGRE